MLQVLSFFINLQFELTLNQLYLQVQEIHYIFVLFLNDTFKFNYHQLISTQQQHLCSKCWWPELSDHYQESSRGRSRDIHGISGHSPRHAAAGSAALHRPSHRHHHPGFHNHRSWLFWNTAHILSGNHPGAVVARELSDPITAENFAQLLLWLDETDASLQLHNDFLTKCVQYSAVYSTKY